MKYYEWMTALADIYLEDSYVLEIRERSSVIEFEMEFVLRPGHVLYRKPLDGEMYCYRRGLIRFENCVDPKWSRHSTVNIDANDEIDLGNIDVFDRAGDRIDVSGEWGKLSLVSDKVLLFVAL
jgi:hypothetical protein